MSVLRWIYMLTSFLTLLDTKRTQVNGGKIKGGNEYSLHTIRSEKLVELDIDALQSRSSPWEPHENSLLFSQPQHGFSFD